MNLIDLGSNCQVVFLSLQSSYEDISLTLTEYLLRVRQYDRPVIFKLVSPLGITWGDFLKIPTSQLNQISGSGI